VPLVAGDLQIPVTADQGQEFPGSRVFISGGEAGDGAGADMDQESPLLEPGPEFGTRDIAHQIAEVIHINDLPLNHLGVPDLGREGQGEGVGEGGAELGEVHSPGEMRGHGPEEVPAMEGGGDLGPEIGGHG